MSELKPIVTDHVYPPIPSRMYDWSAVRDGYEPGDLIGWGATEEEAKRNLVRQERCGKDCDCTSYCGDGL